MSLPSQLKGVDLSGSMTTRESSPTSSLGLNQDQERSPTSDWNPHLEEESVNGNTIDLSEAVASRKYVVVMILQSLIAMFRKRERNLCFREIQNETAESAGQTASRLEASLRESFRLRSPIFLANFLHRINQRANSIRSPNARQVITSSSHPHFRKENSALHETIQDLHQKPAYKISQMDSLRANYNQLCIHNTELNDKLRASKFEISELRKKNGALMSILHKVLSSDRKGGKKDEDMAGSDIHVGVNPTGPSKKGVSLNSQA